MPDYSAGSASVEIKPSFDGFVNELRAFLASVDTDLTINVNADTRSAADEIALLTRDRDMTINVDADTRVAADEIAFLTRDRRMTVHVDVNGNALSSAISQVINNNRVDNRTIFDNSSTNRTTNRYDNRIIIHNHQVSTSADRARNSLNAMGAVKFTALASAISSLVPLIGGVIGAAGALGGILGAVGVTGAIGGAGIGDAFKAMKQASDGAGAAAEDYQSKLDSLSDAQQRVTDAQHDEKSALEAVTDAQKARTQAAEDAKDAIDDLNLAVNNGILSEEGAEIAYRRAVVRQAEVEQRQRQGKASQLDVDEARLNTAEAAQNITNVRVQNEQTRRDRDEANAKGVAGSDQVQAADKTLETAQYNVTKSQQATETAIRDLARAQEAANKAFEEAQGNTETLAEALAKLSPSAADFVLSMKDLGPRWTELRQSVQQELFDGLGETVTSFFNNQADSMQDTFTQLAGGLNDSITGLFDQFDQMWTRLDQNGTLQKFIDAVNESMQSLAPTLTSITEAFMNFTIEAGPSIGRLFESIGQLLLQTSGPLGQLGADLADTLSELLPHLGDFINELAINLAPILPQLGDTITAIFEALTPLLPDMGEFVTKLLQMLENLAPLLEPLGELIFDNLMPLMDALSGFSGNSGVMSAANTIIAIADAILYLTNPIRMLADVFALFTDPTEGIERLLNRFPALKNFTNNKQEVAGVANPRPRADGGVEEPGQAQIADRTVYQYGEPETMGEAWIPFNPAKRARSSQILSTVADKFGYRLVPMSNGGFGGVTTQGSNQSGSRPTRQIDTQTGADLTPREQEQLGGAPIATSLWQWVKTNVPGVTLNSAMTDHDPDGGYHPKGMAIDIGGNMQAAAEALYGIRDNITQIIWDNMPSWYNVGGQRAEGQAARGIYTEAVMAQHANHVHAATDHVLGGVVTNQSGSYTGPPGTTYYSPTGTYVGPSSVDATGDLAELGTTSTGTDLGLPAKYSLQGILGRAGVILADGILGGLGLENSILSSSNTYNQALNTTIDFYDQKRRQGLDPLSPAPGASPDEFFAARNPDGSLVTQTPGASTPLGLSGVGPSDGSVQGDVRAQFAKYGWGDGEQWAAADWIIQHESGWNPKAVNPSSGAAGLGQFLGGTKDKYLPAGIDATPSEQGDAMARYIRDRYGDPLAAKAFWEANNWYDQGGVASGIGVMLKNVIRPERVLSPSNTETFDSILPILDSINTGGWSPSAPAPVEAEAKTTSLDRSIQIGNVSVMNMDEFRNMLDRWQTEQTMALRP